MTFLPPDPLPAVSYADQLDNLLHDFIAGVTGLDGKLVRPRWQPFPPNQPDFDTNWCAFGITSYTSDAFAWVAHEDTGGLGTDILERDEIIKVLHSFYGPQGSDLMGRYRDGAQMGQNRTILTASQVNLIEFQEAVNLPALLKERWVKRIDISATFRRRVRRSYQVPSVEGATVGLDNEFYVTPIIVNPPTP